jgi:hypothetical protein
MAVVVGLFVFGLITLGLLSTTNSAIYRYRLRLDMIAGYFHGELEFDEYTPYAENLLELQKKRYQKIWKGNNGRVLISSALNVGIGSVFFGLMINWWISDLIVALLSATFFGVVVYLIQRFYLHRIST